MATHRNVVCPENEGLAMFLFEKWDEMAKKDTYTDRLDATLSKAYRNLCDHKEPIRDLKDASKIKGIGNWTMKLLKEYYKSDEEVYPSSQEASEPTVKKSRGSGRYLPQKGSAPYAILITLYRATQNEKEFMLKQELIDAAEASGLSRMPIGPSKSGAPPGRFGNSFKDWYCGWSSMKTLTSKGLVVKSSCPANFEQMCINLTNEKLQQHFNQHVFKMEQEEYIREGINWSNIDFVDNQDVLDLIEKKPGGIIALLDEACMFPKSTHETFAQKMYQTYKTHKRFSKPKLARTEFTINHYAGDVTYLADLFLEKNKDFVVPEHQALLNASPCSFVSSLFPPPPEESSKSSKFSSIGARFKE